MLNAECLQLFRRDIAARLRNHIGRDQQLVFFHFFADAGTIRDRGMRFQYAFDFVRRHAIAEALDDIVAASQEPKIAVVIDFGVVTGEKIAIVPILCRFIGLIPVTQKQSRVRFGHGDHAFFTVWRGFQRVRIQQSDFMSGLCESGRARANRAMNTLR